MDKVHRFLISSFYLSVRILGCHKRVRDLEVGALVKGTLLHPSSKSGLFTLPLHHPLQYGTHVLGIKLLVSGFNLANKYVD